MTWQITHGQVRGAYTKLGAFELYVRQKRTPGGFDGWIWFVDGVQGGCEADEATARAAAEACIRNSKATRAMVRAKAACVAATA